MTVLRNWLKLRAVVTRRPRRMIVTRSVYHRTNVLRKCELPHERDSKFCANGKRLGNERGLDWNADDADDANSRRSTRRCILTQDVEPHSCLTSAIQSFAPGECLNVGHGRWPLHRRTRVWITPAPLPRPPLPVGFHMAPLHTHTSTQAIGQPSLSWALWGHPARAPAWRCHANCKRN
jgi:hypothetical protein